MCSSITYTCVLLLLLSLLLSLTTSKVSISEPQALSLSFNNLPLTLSYANYGEMKTAFHAKGKVFIPPKQSSPDIACSPLTDIKLTDDNFNYQHFPVILIPKGNCSYVQITRNVQAQGGLLAIIINDKPGSIESIIPENDGTAKDISIPTALISYEDGNRIYSYMYENAHEDVFFLIDFSLPKSNDVMLTLYMNIADVEMFTLMKEFNTYYNLLKPYITFKPVYVTTIIDNNNNSADDVDVNVNCVSNGKYCLNLNFPNNFEMTGRDLIMDSLFHQCLFTLSTQLNHNEHYFNFINNFINNCLYNTTYRRYCGYYNTNNVIPKQSIMECIYESFGTNRYEVEDINLYSDNYLSNENAILYTNAQIVNGNGIKYIPSVTINKHVVSGRLTPVMLFKSICDAFITKPSVCLEHSKQNALNNEKNGLTKWEIFGIGIAVLVGNALVFCICRRYVIKRVRERIEKDEFDIDGKINEVVNSYLNLQDIKPEKEKEKE